MWNMRKHNHKKEIARERKDYRLKLSKYEAGLTILAIGRAFKNGEITEKEYDAIIRFTLKQIVVDYKKTKVLSDVSQSKYK